MACRESGKSLKRSLIADQRGAVALEVPIIYVFLILIVLMPLADLAVAGFQYISAFAALRGFGQSILYSPPPDVTNTTTWAQTATAKADSRYPISSFQLICGEGNAVCSSTNSDPSQPKYYSYATTVTLAPMVLRSVLCVSGNTNPCTYTLYYSERFQ
ncbi:hypothetical protein [Bradyrhizobium sp. CCBAU 53421]|uniref:hypothetical protein n=1 Tax=Bradyrhizobium sp. CCBAU 53421 TaxID=1325120 RepID=UPI00188CFC99|nr:hypothetical protein [Bradyrhizobium sp. CCBAU 53421]QOZ35166.1 hypothetical protein XH92_28710 [Bradyrhizobium sp. CCBAU 53421]